MKNFVPKEGRKPPSAQGRGRRNSERDLKRPNDTHSSTTDPDARLFRKAAGKEDKLCYTGHLMMENRNWLVVDARLTEADGTADRATALGMIKDHVGLGSTVGGDKNFDTANFVAACRNSAVRRMFRRTRTIAVQQSMPARHAIPATALAR